jgi:hypothetical protein
MTQATASDEAVLMFAGPSEWEQEARERLYPLGCVTESPYQLAPGETLLLLRAFVRDGHGRANTASVLGGIPGWEPRGGILESALATYRRSAQ